MVLGGVGVFGGVGGFWGSGCTAWSRVWEGGVKSVFVVSLDYLC